MEAEPIKTEANKAEPPKRKRRWFQFHLRVLLIFTLIIAVGCAWLASKKQRERQAVKLILSKGGQVGFDYQKWTTPAGQKGFLPTKEPPGPAWLRAILGNDFFGEVVFVFFDYNKPSNLTDADLESLKHLTQIEQLWLPGSNVTDAGLVHLRGMTKLRYLDFRGSSVTDAGINDLKKALPNCDIVR